MIYLPLLAPTTHPTEAFQLFSKQFRKANSPKFTYEILHRPGSEDHKQPGAPHQHGRATTICWGCGYPILVITQHTLSRHAWCIESPEDVLFFGRGCH